MLTTIVMIVTHVVIVFMNTITTLSMANCLTKCVWTQQHNLLPCKWPQTKLIHMQRSHIRKLVTTQLNL
jgi:hypothetical protein